MEETAKKTTRRRSAAKTRAATPRRGPKSKGGKSRAANEAGSDTAHGYNRLKSFEGRPYTGMKIGRSHKWNYDRGVWRETKITPELWQISYAVTKRRAGHAPEGSGVPVGTGYHWYIMAHQNVHKINADDYTTSMTGIKYKLAHKRATSDQWSATAKTQRKDLIQLLKDTIAQLEEAPIPLEIDYKGTHYSGDAVPLSAACHDGFCEELEITLNNESLGIIRALKNSWKMESVEDQGLVKAIGKALYLWFS